MFAAHWSAFKALHCFTKISLWTVSLVRCAVLSARRTSRLAARMLLLIHGAERCLVTHLVLSVAVEELLHQIIVLLSQFFLRAVTQYWAAHGLHLRLELLKVDMPMFWEVTVHFFLRGLNRFSEKKNDLWSDRRFSDTDTLWMSVQSSAVTSQSRIWPCLWVGSSTIWVKLCSESREQSFWTSGLVCPSKWRLKSPMITVLSLSVSRSSRNDLKSCINFLSWAYSAY